MAIPMSSRQAPPSGHVGAPRPRQPAPRRHSRAPAVLAVVVVIAAATAGLLALRGGGWHGAPSAEDLLLLQIRQAAAGTVVSPHAFGGALHVDRADGRTNVTAEALPASACVEVGIQLAHGGTVIVNGVLPQRISAAKLAELCALDPKGATLVWAPQ